MAKKRKIDGFIYSSPRSGSTVLRLNLNKLEKVIALPETHFFTFLSENKLSSNDKISSAQIIDKWVNYHTVQKIILNQSHLLDTLKENATIYLDLLEYTIGLYMDENDINGDGRCVLEKSPPHIYFQDSIAKAYPHAKSIYLVRDPRDVAASLKYCNWSTSNVYINAKLWMKGVSLIGSGFVIRYEDLVEKPNDVVRGITDFLGVDYDDKKVNEPTEDDIEKKNYSSANSFKPISAAFVGNFSEKLSKPDRELEIIEHLAKVGMKKFNYEPIGSSKDLHYRINKFLGWCQYMIRRIY